MKMKIWLAVVLLAIVCTPLIAEPLDLALFAKKAEFNSIKLSPDGKHLALSAPIKEKTNLVILETKTMKPVYNYNFDGNKHVGSYYWASNERLVFSRNIKRADSALMYSSGELYAGNIDGSKKSTIFGVSASGSSKLKSHVKVKAGAQDASAQVVHLLPDDSKHIIVLSRNFGQSFDSPVKLYKLNIFNSKRELIAKTPFGNMNMTLNDKGEPVVAYGTDRKGEKRTFFFKNKKWQEIAKDSPLQELIPNLVNKKGDRLYLTARKDGGTRALYLYDFNTKKVSTLFQDEVSDISDLLVDKETNNVVGVETQPGKVEYTYIEPDNSYAKLHAKLVAAFKGSGINITSISEDKKEVVVAVLSDKNPGHFYLFNNETNKAKFLMATKRWIKPSLMVERKPVQITARDGFTLHGYLTEPKAFTGKAPLVTYVHGGPYGPRDRWWFDSDAQMLANNGYAVLQINYRGSGGYGADYEEVAHQKRSTLIQHDIIDATKWAMAQDSIANKACIMGWSFGGYSALMAPLIETDLFSCSIAAAGVYDALEQEADADYARIDSVSVEAEKVYGKDKDLLRKESPITYIDKLKIPVLIVHGGRDTRVTPEQAHILRAALEKRNMPYEWLFKKTEGHGFIDEENKVEFYQKTLNFLNKYLN